MPCHRLRGSHAVASRHDHIEPASFRVCSASKVVLMIGSENAKKANETPIHSQIHDACSFCPQFFRFGCRCLPIDLLVVHQRGVSHVLKWVAGHLEKEHSIDLLAERAAMSRRNFTRHFRQATGTSFKQWLLSQRLAHAQRMLECGDASIEVVAQKAGFGTPLSLRQHFRTAFRTSPSAYRGLYRPSVADEIGAQ